jgi:hypothetical protein
VTISIQVMDTLPEISNREKLNIELDFRLNYIWSLVEGIGWENMDKAATASIIRVAYGQGYTDALTERSAGQLLQDVPGFRITGRKR